MCSQEIAAPWNTIHGMVSWPISWGHWGETGTMHCGERCSSPAGGNPATLGHKHQSFLAEDLFACRTVRRSALGFEALDREPFLPSWPRHGGAWAASLSFWDSLYEVLACGRGCSRPAAPWARERWGWNRWKLSEILLLLFEQVSLVPLQHRLGVQTQTSLTCCCVPLAHQHWRCEQRLGGQGRSLQRQCSVGGQIARERLFHTRHRSLTMLTRPHHITVVIGRGDERQAEKGLEERQALMKRWSFKPQKAFVQLASLQFNMILGRPIDFLFGHSTSDNLHKLLILGWKRGRNILDTPHVNLLGGRQEKRKAHCPRGSRGEVSAWRASNLRERSTDLMGEDGDRDSLISIPPSDPTANPMSAAAAPPQRKRGQRHWELWWKTPSKRGYLFAKFVTLRPCSEQKSR